MVDLVVVRGSGSRNGRDIVEPLLSTNEVALARGRMELDTYSPGQQPVTLTVVYRPNLRIGQLIEVHDALQGRSYRGKIVGISHRISRSEATTMLDILKSAEDF